MPHLEARSVPSPTGDMAQGHRRAIGTTEYGLTRAADRAVGVLWSERRAPRDPMPCRIVRFTRFGLDRHAVLPSSEIWMLRRLGIVMMLACLAGTVGCDTPIASQLSGSVASIYPLGFVETRAHVDDGVLTIDYVAGDGQLPVQVIVYTSPESAATIDLATDGDIIGRRDGLALPARKRGTLILTRWPSEDGEQLIGTFDAVLTTGEQDYTLFGSFETELDTSAP